MKLVELLTESRAPLYHAMSLEHAVHALKNDALEGRTTQRYWPDGRPRKDNDPEYNDSFWMKGISLTRDKNYANRWGLVVFALDQNQLRNKYPIQPMSWNYLLSIKNAHHKKEKEEFLITKKTGSKDLQPDTVHGYVRPLSKFLLNITLDQEGVKIYKENNENIQYILKHPKFAGFFKGLE